uniref:DDE Tnp4 domain-containing protein n=1 Tax=Anopheles maculatus TaxID=74869 RepID=A0A182S6B0_9DIPT
MLKNKAGIMKIHNHNTNAPHEKVRTRSVVSKEAQQANGTARAVVVGGGASAKQQQQKPNQQKAAAATSSAPVTKLSPELENTTSRLTLEAGKRGRRRGLPKEQQEVHEEQTEEEVNNESQEEEVLVEESGAEKRRRLTRRSAAQRHEQDTIHTDEEEPNHKQQAAEAASELENNEQEQNDTTETAVGEEEDAETESLVEDLNEDDRTSSSTVSAEETLDQVMESFNKGRISTINSGGSKQEKAHSSAASIDPLTMTMDDYQQQQQQQQNDDAPMEDYEPTVTVVGGSASASDDIEDTDGTQAGNRLFRKKVKRKLPVRPNSVSTTTTTTTINTTVSNSGGGGGGVAVSGVGGGSDSAANCSSKAKLQMVHEFPMLFLGLRRNRMFLVNSLAQWFDLNQRDIILTLRKIKQNESSVRLGGVFGLGSTEVELLFHKNVPKIADCLRNFIVWPDDITMKLNVPISLRQHFQRIHLILNYLVVRVKQNAVQELPAEEIANSFCPNEQCHKLKYLVASTLDGCVCFVSRAFGVQADDEQVLSQSGFLTKFKTNTNLIAGKNFHNFEDQLANGHDHTNNNGGHGRRNRVTSASRSGGMADGDDDLERVLGGSSNSNSVDNFEDIVSEKISKSKTFKLKNYIENILENFQSHQLLSPQTCIDARTLKLLDDIVVIVGALINLQKQEIDSNVTSDRIELEQ